MTESRLYAQAVYENGGGPGGAPLPRIDPTKHLKVVTLDADAMKVGGDSQSVCSICVEEMQAGDKIYSLPCVHTFHMECLGQWLQRKGECPECRQPVIDEKALAKKKGGGGIGSGSGSRVAPAREGGGGGGEIEMGSMGAGRAGGEGGGEGGGDGGRAGGRRSPSLPLDSVEGHDGLEEMFDLGDNGRLRLTQSADGDMELTIVAVPQEDETKEF